MPELNFQVESAQPLIPAAAPHLVFGLRISQTPAPNSGPIPIHCVMLQTRISIEPAMRGYSAPQQARMFELFGEPQLWGRTLRSLLWAQCSVTVPSFTGEISVALPVPCNHDFNFAATKYFHALAGTDGDVPLSLLFNGTIFYEGAAGALQAAPIAWDREASFRLPVQTWQRMIDYYYPGGAWLCVGREVFDRLYQYKAARPLMTWDEALDSLLSRAEREVRS